MPFSKEDMARRAAREIPEGTIVNLGIGLPTLVADYLRRPNLKALPGSQRQLISLVLWKLLASSTHAIAGALETMAKRLQAVLDETPDVPALVDQLDEDYESLDETAEEWNESDDDNETSHRNERNAVTQEICGRSA